MTTEVAGTGTPRPGADSGPTTADDTFRPVGVPDARDADWYTPVVDMDRTICVASGRTLGFAEHGSSGDTAVIWCHGGPGNRLAPAYVAPAAVDAGLRLVGIDRPGYGLSTAQPGRTIGGWVPEVLAIADHLGIDRFVTVGTSTRGAYALAVAALAPDRVLGVVPCCAMTDMRCEPWRAPNADGKPSDHRP
jgi:pimeloyl-ACP methyl ester carboxylesterase